MISFKSIGIAVALAAVVLVIGAWVTGDHGPSSSLIRHAMEKEVAKHSPDARVTKVTFIRAGSFVPESHLHVPKGTSFYPVRAEASYTSGNAGTETRAATLYFYRNKSGQWVNEVNSF